MVRHRRRGTALLLGVVSVFVVALAAHVLYGALLADFQAYRSEETQIVLRALTDASLASTLARLSQEPGSTGIPRQPLGRGYIESHVRPLPGGLLEVTASAESGAARASVVARVAPNLVVLSWERSEPSERTISK